MSLAPAGQDRKNASQVRRGIAKRYQKDITPAPAPVSSQEELPTNKNGATLEAARALATDLASLPSPSRQRSGAEQCTQADMAHSEAPLCGQRPSYRDQLRANGQQALQRVQANGMSSGASPKVLQSSAGASPTCCSFGQVSNDLTSIAAQNDRQLPYIPLCSTSPHSSPLNSPHPGQQNVNWSEISAAGQQSPMQFAQQSPLGFASPLGQSSPLSFGMCPQAPTSMTPTACCQQDMMAHFMPCVFNGLDGEQIAHQLNAAAPDVYED